MERRVLLDWTAILDHLASPAPPVQRAQPGPAVRPVLLVRQDRPGQRGQWGPQGWSARMGSRFSNYRFINVSRWIQTACCGCALNRRSKMRPLLLAGLVLLIIGLALVIVGFVVTGFEVAKWIGIAVAIVGLGIAVVDWASARRIR